MEENVPEQSEVPVKAKKEKKPKKKSIKEEFPVHLENFQGSKQDRLQQLYQKWHKCVRCPLNEFRMDEDGNPVDDIVFASGNPEARIVVVGEAPGEDETKHGVPFVGASGRLLNQILAAAAPDKEMQDLAKWYSKVSHTAANSNKFHEMVFEWRDKNFFFTNIVGCRPPENRTPIPTEIAPCNERLANILYIVDPLVVVAVGKTAAEALTGKKIEIRMKRGELFDSYVQGRVTQVAYPTILALHPSYLLRVADWGTPGGEYDKTLDDFSRVFKIRDFMLEKSR